MSSYQFPPNFLWGAATSSYQIEGAKDADGKGESIWDRFSHTPGKVEDAHTGDVACNHYNLWPTDVALMQSLNMQAYRFSISWPRILPNGRGAINQAGLDFYSRLVDGLLAANIQPYVTLYHWDLPQALEDAGGWPARSTAEAFAEYADVVSRHLGDRVQHWITHNEPFVAAFLGYSWGIHAPGHKDQVAGFRAAHHLLLSHGLAVPIIRANNPQAEVGITLNLNTVMPASPSAADYHAARRYDGLNNRWFLDPVYGRHYPADITAEITTQHFPHGLDFIEAGDMETIATHTDFLGINYYSRGVARDNEAANNLPRTEDPAHNPHTDIGWEVYPDGLHALLTRLHVDYRVPKIYITENGASYGTGPNANGRVPDTARQQYLQSHFQAAHRAISDGVPLAGYFVWSLLDNFEWGYGYNQRFGIVWVDYETQQRIPKDSALWYRDVIAANGFTI
jgi:beta-glucosidase